MSANQTYPRPKPRWAGFDDLVFVAVDAVVTGVSKGQIGLIVGGVVLFLGLLAVGGAVWWRRARLRRARHANSTVFTTNGERFEMSSAPSITPFAPTPRL